VWRDIDATQDIVAISETRLNKNQTTMDDYSFLHNDSPTRAGGVGLDIKQKYVF